MISDCRSRGLDLFGHVPISSCSEVFVVIEKTIMSKISASPSKRSAPQKMFTILGVLIGKIYSKSGCYSDQRYLHKTQSSTKKLLGFFLLK